MSSLLVLIGKNVREQRFALAFAWVMLVVFCSLGAYLFKTFGDTNIEIMSRLTPELVVGMFGGLFSKVTPLESWLLALYVHPLPLTVLSIVVVAACTRSLAAEIDRGTIDVLLSCPVPRWQLVVAVIVVVQVALAVLVGSVFLAMQWGLQLAAVELPETWPSFRWVAFNLWALFSAVSGVTLAISASASDQSRALGRSIAFLVISFLVNLLASLWPMIKSVELVSLFHYHRPQPVIEGSSVAVDLGVLLAVTLLGYTLALVCFVRRDISAA